MGHIVHFENIQFIPQVMRHLVGIEKRSETGLAGRDIVTVVDCSVVDPKRYRKVTSYCRSIQLLGYTVGSVLGQLLVSFHLMSYDSIMVMTLVFTAIALLFSCLLPMPKRSMFFHRRHSGQKNQKTEGEKTSGDGTMNAVEHASMKKISLDEMNGEKVDECGETVENTVNEQEEKGTEDEDFEELVGQESCRQVILQLWWDIRQCYSSRQLLYWSLWWALATCCYNQTVNYVQVSGEAHIKQKKENLKVHAILEMGRRLCDLYQCESPSGVAADQTVPLCPAQIMSAD